MITILRLTSSHSPRRPPPPSRLSSTFCMIWVIWPGTPPSSTWLGSMLAWASLVCTWVSVTVSALQAVTSRVSNTWHQTMFRLLSYLRKYRKSKLAAKYSIKAPCASPQSVCPQAAVCVCWCWGWEWAQWPRTHIPENKRRNENYNMPRKIWFWMASA